MRVTALSSSLLLAFNCYAQRIQNFNLYPTSTSVVVKFTISAGPSCNRYTVLHSSDSLTYEEVGADPGICGTTSAPDDKSFTHLTPVFGKINYYRVRLEPYVETSNPKAVYVSSEVDQKMHVYPNPITTIYDWLTLKFFNLTNSRLVGNIYNQLGKPLNNLDFNTVASKATLGVSSLENGLYVIRLTDGTQNFTGKFIIFR